ncbi:MAG: DNA mismatch repair endonuclease MutL [Myxococcota bacterium]
MSAPTHVAVLPEALSNQIAAGEVVERPASVVKELLENALDAEATTVFVEVEDGGRRLIRIVDDGLGMRREDARLAVQRHATSKIRSAEDLRVIGTLGFRGEALPSIASVSRFTMVTRAEGDVAGTEVRIDGGGEPQVRDAGGPVGTRIEVRDLFHNVPARLKFLKRTATEMGHLKRFVTAAALGYPHVHLRLSHNGRVSVDHPVAPSLKQRIFQVLGRKTTERLYEVRLDGPIRVRGYLSEPTYNRTNQAGIHTFINGRHVRDRVVNHAIVSAYGNLLERGRYPYAVLYVHLDPQEMDVNVHPAKAEVRFVKPGRVHEAIVRACRVTLTSAPWGTRSDHNPLYEPAPQPSRPSGVSEPGGTPLPMDAWGLARRERTAPSRASAGWRPSPSSGGPPPPTHAQELDFDAPAPGEPQVGEKRRFFSRMRVLGQAAKTYLVCENADGLYVIDQHAAHERVGYERIKAGWCDARLARQQLLFPLQLELSAPECAAVEEHGETLERLGLRLEPFGGQTWQVTMVPALLAKSDVERLVRDVVAELADIGKATLAESHMDLLFSTMACHAVVRAGDSLNHEEIRALLEAMDEADLGPNCPHGRPVLVSIPFRDLERKLHRT